MLAIAPNDHVFILTGAGVSAESGIPTFRGVNGLWRNYRIEEVASPHAWARDPLLVWEFYSMRRNVAAGAKPNPAHFALATLGENLGDRLFLCAQNVDNLHEQGLGKCPTNSIRFSALSMNARYSWRLAPQAWSSPQRVSLPMCAVMRGRFTLGRKSPRIASHSWNAMWERLVRYYRSCLRKKS